MPISMKFLVENVTLGRVFLLTCRFFRDSMIPSMLHTYLHIYVALIRKTNGRVWGTKQKAVLLRKKRAIDTKLLLLCLQQVQL